MSNRDFTLIIDKSGSMETPDMNGGATRWLAAQESTFALAAKCEKLDPDGITIYLFSGNFKKFENVGSSKVSQIFSENDPSGSTDLAKVLSDATNEYFSRKAQGKTKPDGETIVVVTDGEPDDRKAVFKVIIEASRKMERDEELAILIVQVGGDARATKFLKSCDDELQSAGAKFDICNTISIEDMENMTLTEALESAITD